MPPKEPIWILKNAVILIHKRQLSEHGGLDGIRDDGMLESALDRPKNLYAHTLPKPSLAQLAASYGYSITKNHPLNDGNKRTSFVVTELFLRLNKCTIEASKEDKYSTFLSLADGTLSEDDLTSWIAQHIIRRI